MEVIPNPYQAPLEGELSQGKNEPFSEWTTWKMVVLFFLPSLALIISFAGLTFMIPALTIGGLTISVIGAFTVITFSARVHQRRQEAGWGTFFLMTLVYLLAQTFALFITIATIGIVFGNLSLKIH